MDRASMALLGAEDNAAAIKKLRAEQKRLCGATALLAQTDGGKSVFGHVRLAAPTAVIAAFDGDPCALILDGNTVASSASPVMAVISGSGTLALEGVRENARVLILGATEA